MLIHTKMLRKCLRFASFGTGLQRQFNVIMFENEAYGKG